MDSRKVYHVISKQQCWFRLETNFQKDKIVKSSRKTSNLDNPLKSRLFSIKSFKFVSILANSFLFSFKRS